MLQHNSAEAQGVPGHHPAAADSFQLLQRLPVLEKSLFNPVCLQERLQFFFQFCRIEKKRQAVSDMRHQFRKIFSLFINADFSKKAALAEFFRDSRGCPGNFVSVGRFSADVDNQSVLEGQMLDDPAGIGKHRIAVRQRFQDVGFNFQTARFPQE